MFIGVLLLYIHTALRQLYEHFSPGPDYPIASPRYGFPVGLTRAGSGQYHGYTGCPDSPQVTTLRREEVVYLATLLRLTKEGVRLPKAPDSNDLYDLEQSVVIQMFKQLVVTDFFKDHGALNAFELSVQRTGYIRHVTSLASGGDIYAPSGRLEELGKLASFEAALNEEGVYL